MKRVFLDDATPADVSHAVRDVLERRGALVSEHVSSRVRFHGLRAKHTWSRAGYVGIYQALGEREVEVRLLLRARWSWRILLTVAAVNLATALAVVATNPPVNTWILAAFVGGFALLVAGLLHVNTLRPVREEERLLMEDFVAEFHRALEGVRVEEWDERALRAAEMELEGEVTARRVERLRKHEPPAPRSTRKGLRFNLLPGRKTPPPETPAPDAPPVEAPAPESAEERRARLLARKAELETRRRQGGS